MLFGSPQATSFLIWEAWPSPRRPPTASRRSVDNNWNLTQPGQALVNLLDSWTTPTQNLIVGPDGTIDFTGFYGDYEITIGGQTFDLSLIKGTQTYSLVVAPGDYNGDGTVDAADYVVWQKYVGQSTTLINRDAANSGLISIADFNSWRKHFGKTAPGGNGGGNSVPEPSAACVGLVLAISADVLSARRQEAAQN